jgi:hypothetical protein
MLAVRVNIKLRVLDKNSRNPRGRTATFAGANDLADSRKRRPSGSQ